MSSTFIEINKLAFEHATKNGIIVGRDEGGFTVRARNTFYVCAHDGQEYRYYRMMEGRGPDEGYWVRLPV